MYVNVQYVCVFCVLILLMTTSAELNVTFDMMCVIKMVEHQLSCVFCGCASG